MFDNIKIATRFRIALGLIGLMVIAVAVSGYLGLQHVTQTSQEVLLFDAQIAERALAARASSLQLRRYEKDYFLNIGARRSRPNTSRNGSMPTATSRESSRISTR